MKCRDILMPAALAIAVAGMFASAVAGELRVSVIDADTGRGVKAEIYLAGAGANRNIGATDDGGSVVIGNYSYTEGDTVYAQPSDPAYYARTASTSANAPQIRLAARAKWRTAAIGNTAAKFESAGDFGKAAQAYTEAHARNWDAQLKLKAMESAAQALGLQPDVAVVLDPQQKQQVASPTLIAKLKDFQKANDLAPNGILDTSTLNILAGGTVSYNLKAANPSLFGNEPPASTQ
jgi:Putative peptidoglycan binding domain